MPGADSSNSQSNPQTQSDQEQEARRYLCALVLLDCTPFSRDLANMIASFCRLVWTAVNPRETPPFNGAYVFPSKEEADSFVALQKQYQWLRDRSLAICWTTSRGTRTIVNCCQERTSSTIVAFARICQKHWPGAHTTLNAVRWSSTLPNRSKNSLSLRTRSTR